MNRLHVYYFTFINVAYLLTQRVAARLLLKLFLNSDSSCSTDLEWAFSMFIFMVISSDLCYDWFHVSNESNETANSASLQFMQL